MVRVAAWHHGRRDGELFDPGRSGVNRVAVLELAGAAEAILSVIWWLLPDGDTGCEHDNYWRPGR